MDFIEDFIAFASRVGCSPASGEDVVADDVRHYFTIDGDRANSKKGAYQLRIDGDFAVGWVTNYRLGETHTYTSKSHKKLDPHERIAIKQKMLERKREQIKQLEAVRASASAEAKAIWDKAAKSGEHAYLTRKQCLLNGARIYKDKLIIPIYKEGKLTSLQYIGSDGDKMFLKGGEISGGWFPIAHKDDDKSKLIICEGFATADAIRRATRCPIIVAFNAGNLVPIAKVMRKKYPDAVICIAADNDHTKEVNVGLEKAKQAAVAIGGATVVFPEMNGGTDFNDLYIASGLEAVKAYFIDRIESQPEQPPIEAYDDNGSDGPVWLDDMPPLEAYDDEERKTVALYVAGEVEDKSNWKERLFYKEDKLAARHLGNAQLFIEHDKVLGNLFCYDEFCHERVLYRCPPWENVKKFKPRPINDEDITHLNIELERRGLSQTFGNINRLLSSVIKKNSRNPAVEYFNGLKWDGVKRLDNWLITYCGAIYDDERYIQAIGRKWMAAAVNRIFEPGCKFDSMLILEGEQNSGKSYILRELSTIHGREYFNDGIRISDFITPDKIIMKLQGVIIIELAELSSFARMSDEEKKAVISSQTDIATLKYQNEAGRYPRQFVLAGTTNKGSVGYLTDETGNRRFWPARCGDVIDIGGIKKDKEQLWAEAVQAYREGEDLFLKDDLYALAQNEQKKRMSRHPWQPEIEEVCHDKDTVFMNDIWDKLKITVDKRNRALSKDIGGIMTGLGFESTQRRFKGEPSQAWKRKYNDRELDLD